MPEKIDKLEKKKRVRMVMEWVLDDWPAGDIITQVMTKWGVCDRQAKRYLKEARELWSVDDEEIIDRKRRTKILSLKKLKRSLKEEFKGTPGGIRALVAVEKEIIKLEGIAPAKKMDVTLTKLGKDLEEEYV